MVRASDTAGGIFTVDGGTVALLGAHAADRFPANAIVQINNGGTVEFTSVNAANFSANYLIGAGGTLTNAAGVDHAHVGSVQLSGGTWTTDPGAIAYNGENWFLHGNVDVTGSVPSLITQQGGTAANRGLAWMGNATFSVADVTGNSTADLIVSTELENGDFGTASLIKTGDGTMRLSVTNSYTGATDVQAGTLDIDASQTLTSLNIAAGARVVLGKSGPPSAPPAPALDEALLGASAQPVPEPGALALLAISALGFLRRRK